MSGQTPAFQRLPVKDETYITIWPPSRPHTPSHSHNLVATVWYIVPNLRPTVFHAFPDLARVGRLITLLSFWFCKTCQSVFNLYSWPYLLKLFHCWRNTSTNIRQVKLQNVQLVRLQQYLNFTDLTYHATLLVYCSLHN